MQSTHLIITGQQCRFAAFEGRSFKRQHGFKMSFFCLCFDHSIFHQVLLTHKSLQIRLQFRFTRGLMSHRRIKAGDSTAKVTASAFNVAQLIVHFRQSRIGSGDFLFRSGLTRAQVLNNSGRLLHLADQCVPNVGFATEIIGSQSDPKLFQLGRDRSEASRTLCLSSDGTDLSLDFIHQIRQANEICFNSFQSL